MERKQGGQEGERFLQSSRISINGDVNHDDDDDHHESLCVLKREIACHSLYSFLLQSHFNCLNICLGKVESSENVMINPEALPNQHDQSELDQFMEAYCETLNKLREVMEEPQQESMAFINLMYSQLDELPLQIPSTRGRES